VPRFHQSTDSEERRRRRKPLIRVFRILGRSRQRSHSVRKPLIFRGLVELLELDEDRQSIRLLGGRLIGNSSIGGAAGSRLPSIHA
jgi:hypothetical protein